jgi:hypothetical protein
MRLSKPKLSFVHYPLSSISYSENYSQANTMIYVWMIRLLHMLPSKQKRKNQASSFPRKAQDKINPTYRFKAKMNVFLAFVGFFAITCL